MLNPDPTFHFDADPDSAFHFDADPDSAFQFDADPDLTFRSILWVWIRLSTMMRIPSEQ
jgi:hypothetical protein